MNEPTRHFGMIPRPFDPAELKYSTLFAPVPKADWNTPVGIEKGKRAAIWNQGGTSSCTASICEAIESGALAQGRTVPQLSHEDIYWRARARQNFFGQGQGADTGSYIADICDEALAGIGREDLHPFDGSVWDAPTAAVAADRVNQIWVAKHVPLYPGPGTMARVWDALSKGYPVVMGWILDGSMYDPPSRPYPRGLNPQASGQHGYHQSIILRMRRYTDGRLYIGGPNSWGESFNPRINEWWPEEARPGEWWADAEDWLERSVGPVIELRALEMVPYVAPEPEPEPMDYREGYDDARDQDLDFIDGMVKFYREQGSEWGDFAERICQYQIEIMRGFTPPAEAPTLPPPPTMGGA